MKKRNIAIVTCSLSLLAVAVWSHLVSAGIEDPPVCGTFASEVNPVGATAGANPGFNYSTDFEASEGFTTTGYIAHVPAGVFPVGCDPVAQNPGCWGHTAAANASLITPTIDTVNPATGIQHLRLTHDPATRTNQPSFGLGVDARFPHTGAANPTIRPVAPTTVSVDLAISGPGGQNFRLQPQSNSQGCIQGSALFFQDGGIYILDDLCGTVGLSFLPTGFQWDTTGAYQNFVWVMNPCTNSMEYYYGGQMIYSGCVVFGTNLEQFLVFGDNFPGSHMDVDNVVMTSLDGCPSTCGNGVLEDWAEQCEPGIAECNPGHTCGAAGTPEECTCNRICTMDEPCELTSGTNGPFYGPFDAAYGGIFQYQAPAGVDAVSVELCGSTGGDQRIFYWGSCTDPGDPGSANDDCCNPNSPDCGANFGAGSDPNASCYNEVGAPNWEPCTCHNNPLPDDQCYLLRTQTPSGAGQVFIEVGNNQTVCPTVLAVCGNEIVEGPIEDCEPGNASGCGPGFICGAVGTANECECIPNPGCGNGLVEGPVEECEPGLAPSCGSGSICGFVGTANECQCIPEPVCGDGVLESPYEDCEPGGPASCNSGFVCADAGTSYECQCILNIANPSGKIVAWGENIFGQLNVPPPNTDFVAVAGGRYHSLGLKTNGSVVAWGDNTFGQTDVPEPNSNFVAISAGDSHSLGLKADGSIVAWGYDFYGQSTVPEPNTDFIAVAAGKLHSLGLKNNGTVVQWGFSPPGGLNIPSPNINYLAISGAAQHSLALRPGGVIVDWGIFGDLPTANSGFIAISASQWHNLALRESAGSIAAFGSFGSNDYGQLNVPSPNSGFSHIATGDYHSLGLRETGVIAAWGCGTPFNRGQCTVPLPNSDFVAIEAGNFHSLGIRLDLGGACCDTHGPDAGCVEAVREFECVGSDRSWTEGGSCSEITCPCTPDCTGRVCGDAGCGETCGQCDDGNVCNGSETCSANGLCDPGMPLVCNDGNACNGVETCNPSSGCVPGTPPNCNDGDYCNGMEVCVPQSGCGAGTPPCAEDETCDEDSDECTPNTIPTVGDWGLAVIALILLIAAKLQFRRVRRAW